ncbi:hypothetical protein IW261DRAFT_1348306 [Armillaria novae-zelandiae]|uniref:CCHC-type domain-containing protein n=1 Tax=Armillaria novae-zelandiae TaxID=153914 RepID=A0AA39NBP5_9AGAR|nr:hypothetical protein IW261DRAFT_1348306 [Armillaria novae-zelandiae]
MRPRLPKPFNGQRTEYRKFRQSVRLCLAADKGSMDDKSKILFILSYMREGLAGMWAENYMDDHFDGDHFNGGTYADFIKELDQAFLDPAMEEDAEAKLETFQQGGRRAQEFFIEFDRLRRDAGRDDQYTAKLFPKALNNRLRASFFLSAGLQEEPTTYQGWKERVIKRDAIYWRHRAFMAARSDGSSGEGALEEGSLIFDEEGASDGEMDLAEMRRKGLCFSCGKHGHLARNCRNVS